MASKKITGMTEALSLEDTDLLTGVDLSAPAASDKNVKIAKSSLGFAADDDPRLSDARAPTSHAASHEDGGSDELALVAAQITDFQTTVSQNPTLTTHVGDGAIHVTQDQKDHWTRDDTAEVVTATWDFQSGIKTASLQHDTGSIDVKASLKMGGAEGYGVVITDDAEASLGGLGPLVDDNGVFIARFTDVYDPNDGGIAMKPGILELQGTAITVPSFAHTNELGRVVYVSEEGVLYPVDPAAPGWSDQGSDIGDYDLGTGTEAGPWVNLTGTEAFVQEAVAAGDPVDIQAQVYAVNKVAGWSGVIEIGFGPNDVAPPTGKTSQNITGGFAGYLPFITFTTTTHGGLAVNDKVTIFARLLSGEHNSFGVDLLGSISEHQLVISVPAGGGGVALPARVSEQEKTDGTSAELRSFAPVDVADMVTAHETVGAGTGDVTGPAGGVEIGEIPQYDDTTGKVIGDGYFNQGSYPFGAARVCGLMPKTSNPNSEDGFFLSSSMSGDSYILLGNATSEWKPNECFVQASNITLNSNAGVVSIPTYDPGTVFNVDALTTFSQPVHFAGAALDQNKVVFYDPDWWIGLSSLGGRLDINIGADPTNNYLRVMSGTDQRFAVANNRIVANVPIEAVPPAAANHLATRQYVDDSVGGAGDVTGPAGGVVQGQAAQFEDTTGKVISAGTLGFGTLDAGDMTFGLIEPLAGQDGVRVQTSNGLGTLTIYELTSPTDPGRALLASHGNGNVSLSPSGTGVVSIEGNATVLSTKHITQDDPVNPQHVATKKYVDDNVNSGDVVGPAGGVEAGEIPQYDDTTGKLIGDGYLKQETYDWGGDNFCKLLTKESNVGSGDGLYLSSGASNDSFLMLANASGTNWPGWVTVYSSERITLNVDGGSVRVPNFGAGTTFEVWATSTFYGAVTGVDPTDDAHLATKKYVDDNVNSGDVVGPAGGVEAGEIPQYDDTTGKLLDSASLVVSRFTGTPEGNTGIFIAGKTGTNFVSYQNRANTAYFQVREAEHPDLASTAAIKADNGLSVFAPTTFVYPTDFTFTTTSVAEPTADSHAATKKYVDDNTGSYSEPVVVDLASPTAGTLLTLDAETGHTGNIMNAVVGTTDVFTIEEDGGVVIQAVPGSGGPVSLIIKNRNDDLTLNGRSIAHTFLEDTAKFPQIFWPAESEFLGTLRVRDPEDDYQLANWGSGVSIGSTGGQGYMVVKSARSGVFDGQIVRFDMRWDNDGHAVQGVRWELSEGDGAAPSNLRLYHHGRNILHSGTTNLNLGNLESNYGFAISYTAGVIAHLHQVANETDAFYWQKSGVTNCVVRGSGAIYNNGGVFGALSSSRSLKQDITPLNGSLAKVCALIPSSFAFKTEPDEPQVGFIAEELGEVLPDLLAHHDDGSVGVSTSKLIPILVNAVQELTARVEELEAKVVSDDLH